MLALLSLDQALGRFNFESVSDQTLMEMLVDIESGQMINFKEENGEFKDVCAWEIVECRDDRVTAVIFSNADYSQGQFPFNLIPPLTTRVVIEDSRLRGTLNTSHLPLNLTEFNVDWNQLHGFIDFRSFPRGLQDINISRNAFEGSLALSDLPDALIALVASMNKFSGEISMNDLPTSMEKLLLGRNKLTGSINIERLPKGMNCIDFNQNSFTGVFTLLDFPPNLAFVNIATNRLSKKAVLRSSSDDMPFTLCHYGIQDVFDENGNRHAWEDTIVDY